MKPRRSAACTAIASAWSGTVHLDDLGAMHHGLRACPPRPSLGGKTAAQARARGVSRGRASVTSRARARRPASTAFEKPGSCRGPCEPVGLRPSSRRRRRGQARLWRRRRSRAACRLAEVRRGAGGHRRRDFQLDEAVHLNTHGAVPLETAARPRRRARSKRPRGGWMYGDHDRHRARARRIRWMLAMETPSRRGLRCAPGRRSSTSRRGKPDRRQAQLERARPRRGEEGRPGGRARSGRSASTALAVINTRPGVEHKSRPRRC